MKQVVLIILDGWGEGEHTLANPLTKANLSTFTEMERFYPYALLNASGISVGLLWGEPGNSESGHLNLGAGKIIYQYLPRIILSIRRGSFFTNAAFLKAAHHTKKNSSRLHIMSLFSSGSVHAYSDHLYALLEFAKRQKLSERTLVHVFTDGRDAPPKEGKKVIAELEKKLAEERLGQIGSIMGRKFAMNRNDEWELTQAAYVLLTKGRGGGITNAADYITSQYQKGVTDEYIEPAIVGNEAPLIQDGDAVIFLNYREDSTRQLTKAFVLDDFKGFSRKKLKNLLFVTMTEYEKGLPVEIAFRPVKILKPLAKVISDAGFRQLHVAETEKYAHITYFFNGLKEKAYPREDRVLIPSSKVKSFAETPEMRSPELAIKIKKALKLNRYAFILANFANSDMVAHTGNFEAGIKAAEVINNVLRDIKNEVLARDAILLVTSDHGNIEEMLDINTGETKTEHTKNPVPFYLVGNPFKGQSFPKPEKTAESNTQGILADVAPTVLELLDIRKPDEMTGQSLLALLE